MSDSPPRPRSSGGTDGGGRPAGHRIPYPYEERLDGEDGREVVPWRGRYTRTFTPRTEGQEDPSPTRGRRKGTKDR